MQTRTCTSRPGTLVSGRGPCVAWTSPQYDIAAKVVEGIRSGRGPAVRDEDGGQRESAGSGARPGRGPASGAVPAPNIQRPGITFGESHEQITTWCSTVARHWSIDRPDPRRGDRPLGPVITWQPGYSGWSASSNKVLSASYHLAADVTAPGSSSRQPAGRGGGRGFPGRARAAAHARRPAPAPTTCPSRRIPRSPSRSSLPAAPPIPRVLVQRVACRLGPSRRRLPWPAGHSQKNLRELTAGTLSFL